MKKVLIATAVLFTALPFNFDGVTPTVSKAHAIIGRPLTPFSVAGVHRRAVRRTYGIGANLGYSGYYHRNFGPYAYNRFGYGSGYGYGYGAPSYAGLGWGGGWGGWGWNRPLYSSAAIGWGGGWGGWGWNRPWRRW